MTPANGAQVSQAIDFAVPVAQFTPGTTALAGETIVTVVTVKGANGALGRNWPLAMREVGSGVTVGPAGPWVTDDKGEFTFTTTALSQSATSIWVTPEHGDPEGTLLNISFATPEARCRDGQNDLSLLVRPVQPPVTCQRRKRC